MQKRKQERQLERRRQVGKYRKRTDRCMQLFKVGSRKSKWKQKMSIKQYRQESIKKKTVKFQKTVESTGSQEKKMKERERERSKLQSFKALSKYV